MAIPLNDNLQLSSSKPDFTRQEYETKQAMTQVRDNRMPEMYLAFCLEDRKLYLYDKANEVDPETGRFRPYESGGEDQEARETAAAALALAESNQTESIPNDEIDQLFEEF